MGNHDVARIGGPKVGACMAKVPSGPHMADCPCRALQVPGKASRVRPLASVGEVCPLHGEDAAHGCPYCDALGPEKRNGVAP